MDQIQRSKIALIDRANFNKHAKCTNVGSVERPITNVAHSCGSSAVAVAATGLNSQRMRDASAAMALAKANAAYL